MRPWPQPAPRRTGVIAFRTRINPGAINGVITSRTYVNPGRHKWRPYAGHCRARINAPLAATRTVPASSRFARGLTRAP